MQLAPKATADRSASPRRRKPAAAAPPPAAPRGTGRSDPLGSLKIWQKLALISLAFLVPIAVVVGVLATDQNRAIAATTTKLHGAEYLATVSEAYHLLPGIAGLSAAYQAGITDPETVERLRQEIASLDALVSEIGAFDARFGSEYETTALAAAITQRWRQARADVFTMQPAVAADVYDALTEQVIELSYQIASGSGLLLSDGQAAYITTDILVNEVSNLGDELGDLMTRSFAARVSYSQAQRLQLVGDTGVAEDLIAEVTRSTGLLAQSDAGLGAGMVDLAARAEASVLALVAFVNEQVIAAETPRFAPGDLIERGEAATTGVEELLQASSALLLDSQIQRLEGIRRSQLATLVTIALLVAVTLALVGTVARRITEPVDTLALASERLAGGDLDVVADVDNNDELGALAASFNDAVAQLRDADARQREELERGQRLQHNIGSFLDVAMDIAEGDLTKRGTVSEDVLGNVVDAINLMVEEIAELLRQARDATTAVNAEANGMLGTTGQLLESSAAQRSAAQQARNEVQQVSGSMREMADTAGRSANAADRALGASQRGEQAVSDTLEGMQNIRSEVQGISKRIKSLGDRSLEISEIIETISGIASQTNLLALNAAIEAAGAGEAGRRFATVAAEVRRLAEESAQATKRVSGLIRNVQAEVQEVVASVEDGTREVEDGYRVAQVAGTQLREIGEIARQSAQFAQRISDAAQLQVTNVDQVGGRVEQIAGVAEASDERVREGAEAAQRLQALAQQLTESLARFRLA